MPKYVLTYFNLKGLGECSRMLLAYGGQEFEDRRIERTEWDQYKSKFRFRQLPVLEIDGKEYAQSLAISRYLGQKFGIAGSTPEENLEIDQNADFITDIRLKAAVVMFEQDPEVKKKKLEEHLKTHGWMFEKLHEIIKENNGHIACGKLTWADFVFAGVYDALKYMLQQPDMDVKYPGFKKLQETVRNLPKVKEFLATAPPTDF